MGNSQTARKFGIAAIYAVLFGTTFWLLFSHLDGRLLWGDEAETAVLARNAVRFGVPKTFDGANYVILHGTVDETADHVWIWSPWLQEYIAAASFRLFGATTWAARAPFALAGWACLLALARVAHKTYRNHWVTISCVALLGTSEIFLLHARQCRYHSVSVLAEIVLIDGLQQLPSRGRRGIWLTALALIFQFYSNYIIAFANFPSLFILGWMRRHEGKTTTRRLAAVLGIFAAAIAPWLIYAHPWTQGAAVGGENYARKCAGYLLEFNFHFMPLCFFLLPLIGRTSRPKTGEGEPAAATRQWERLLLALLPIYLAAILPAPGFYLRYLLPLLPVACLLAAVWTFRHVRWQTAAALLIVVQATTNAIPVLTAYPLRGPHSFRMPLVEFARGLSCPYADQLSAVVNFLKPQSKPGELLMSFDPELPLRFYTPLVIIDARWEVPPKDRLPEWYLPRSAAGVQQQTAVPLPDFLKPYYEAADITAPDSRLGDSIPEPDNYEYQTAANRLPFEIDRLKPESQAPPSQPAR